MNLLEKPLNYFKYVQRPKATISEELKESLRIMFHQIETIKYICICILKWEKKYTDIKILLYESSTEYLNRQNLELLNFKTDQLQLSGLRDRKKIFRKMNRASRPVRHQ